MSIAREIGVARTALEDSRTIAQAREHSDHPDAQVESLQREVRELRLGMDRAVYALELLARQVTPETLVDDVAEREPLSVQSVRRHIEARGGRVLHAEIKGGEVHMRFAWKT